MPNDFDILILGAGMAGLTAARALAERNLRVCILEARHRIGGRILSQSVDASTTVELGAEFIHGRAPELWSLIDEATAPTIERHGAMVREHSPGHLAPDDPNDNSLFEPLEQLEPPAHLQHFTRPDQSFNDWLTASNVPAGSRPALTAYVEGFNAADANRISVLSLGIQQQAEDATEGDRSWHLPNGYAQLAGHLAARILELHGQILLDHPALSIHWTPNHVRVETTRGDFTAPRCLITLPLGVLQQVNQPDSLQIAPEPAAISQARRLAMGHATRFALVFRTAFWQASPLLDQQTLRDLSFLFTPTRTPPVWWTSPAAPNTLTGWIGGPRSSTLEDLSPDEIASQACAALAEIFSITADIIRSELLSTHTHNWAADPFARGAYTYVPANAIDASAAMTLPEANTLFFAGEHTDVTGHWGTVHAAIRSGLRAASQLLNQTPPPNPAPSP